MQFLKWHFFLSRQWHKKVKILLSPTLPSPYFSLPFFKSFVTLPPNINELDTVVTLPLSSDPDTPQNLERTLPPYSGQGPYAKSIYHKFTDTDHLFLFSLAVQVAMMATSYLDLINLDAQMVP